VASRDREELRLSVAAQKRAAIEAAMARELGDCLNRNQLGRAIGVLLDHLERYLYANWTLPAQDARIVFSSRNEALGLLDLFFRFDAIDLVGLAVNVRHDIWRQRHKTQARERERARGLVRKRRLAEKRQLELPSAGVAPEAPGPEPHAAPEVQSPETD
jgi:hypothetical protein